MHTDSHRVWSEQELCYHRGMTSETIAKVRCLRCEYAWFPRTERTPVRCPRCKSPYWNRARSAAPTASDERFRGMREGQAYYDAHRDEILRDYMGKYVAVTRDGVIDSADDYSKLADRVFANGSYSLLITKVEEKPRVYRLPVRFRVIKP